jgi:hypothetical protein
MSNTITIELCAEDRARLDRLTAALDNATPNCSACAETVAKIVKDTPAEATQGSQDEPKAEAEENTQPTDEVPWEVAEAVAEAASEAPKPTVTLEQIQQKVRQLAAGFGGAKRAAVRDIINAYAAKVSDIPEDKWPEVWVKLSALEQEG